MLVHSVLYGTILFAWSKILQNQSISPQVKRMVSTSHRLRSHLVLYFSLVRACLGVLTNASDPLDVRITHLNEPQDANSYTCTDQLHASLEHVRRRQASGRTTALIDLSGYALHQPMRTLQADMYVTDIKVRTPGVGNWVQVRRCRSSRRGELTTHLEFSDLLVSGLVKVVPSAANSEPCRMTLRLRRAGLDLKAAAGTDRAAGVQLRTESNFIEPNFLSVHAYGCWGGPWIREEEQIIPELEDFDRMGRSMEHAPEVRVINLDEFKESSMEQRILPDKLAAVLSVKQQIADQANKVFQAHGPFSRYSTPPPPQSLFSPHALYQPIQQQTAAGLPPVAINTGQVSAEMEDIFLRGSKALLAKYLEKQLENPLKETLMRQIGYTVSYG